MVLSASARQHGRRPARRTDVVSARVPAPPANQGPTDHKASSVAAMEVAAPDSPSDRRVRGPWRLRNTAARRARVGAQGQQSPTNRRPRRQRCRELNTDALFDVLLRVPAKDLCRLRAVCRPWRSITTDNIFINLHTASHGPFFLVKFVHDREHIHVMDLSGTVIKTFVNTSADHQVMFTHLSLGCLATERNTCSVLNPATGAFYVLPESRAPTHVNRVKLNNTYTVFTFGRVASTGVFKVLRVFNRPGYFGQQLFELFTINGCAADARWKSVKSPGCFVKPKSAVVVDGVVYLLMRSKPKCAIPPDSMMSFNLVSEEWRRDLMGPISGDPEAVKKYQNSFDEIALAVLKGSLVLVYYYQRPDIMDLWFLTDPENGIWVKEYSIRLVQNPRFQFLARPLYVLDDGRLVVYQDASGMLRIYNPETHSFA